MYFLNLWIRRKEKRMCKNCDGKHTLIPYSEDVKEKIDLLT